MAEVIHPSFAHETQQTPTPLATVVPEPSILLYPRLRKSPYFWKSRAHGAACYSVYNHTYHPRHYGDPIGEYWALLEDVTVWEIGRAHV